MAAPEVSINQAASMALNAAAVNVVRTLPGRGAVVWGARTASDDTAWRYIAVRRLALLMTRDINALAAWITPQPNTEATWAQVRAAIGVYLQGLFHDGAFQGLTPTQAYFVRADAQTMTQDDIAAGRLKVLVGFAAVKPAEFVLLRFDFACQAP